VHFGPWHRLADAVREAPGVPGIVQLRAEAIFAYGKGQSAMVYYACSAPEQTLRDFMIHGGSDLLHRAEQQGACFIRFGETARPEHDLMRLLTRFEERFGSRPIANAAEIVEIDRDSPTSQGRT
jgi:hypothetical protein